MIPPQCRLEPVQLDRVLVEQLLAQWLVDPVHHFLDDGLGVRPRARWMWIVGGPHRFVSLENAGFHHFHTGAILDERHPDIALEILARGQLRTTWETRVVWRARPDV